MPSTNWIAYMEAARGSDTDARVALHMGLSQSAITRWRSGTKPRPQQVVDFARLYNANALSGLIAAGYVNADDLTELGTTVAAPADLNEITTAELLDELQRRLTDLRDTFDAIERNSDREALETLIDALTTRHLPAGNVVRLDDHRIDRITRDEAQRLLNGEQYAADERDGRDNEAEADTTP